MINKSRLLSSIVALVGMLAATSTHADEVTITPVYNSMSSGVGRSYIRLFNPSSETDTTATVRILNANGSELARLSLPMKRLVSKQYEISQLEDMASPKILPTGAATYAVKVSTDKELLAYVQHVIYNDKANTFTNASACDTGRARTRYLINVHAPKLGVLGYPSQIALQSDGVVPVKPVLVITDSEAGTLLSYATLDIINPQEVRLYDLATILSTAKITLKDQFHINIGLSFSSEFVGFPAHLVDNTTSGLITNMAEMCIIPATSPVAVAAPSASYSESGYYTKYADADGVAVRGTRFTRASNFAPTVAIIKHMISTRADIRAKMVETKTTMNIVGRDEGMTEAPIFASERRQSTNQTLSDGTILYRQTEGSRGLGGNNARLGDEYSMGELLAYYVATERYFVLVHEFTHTIHALLPTVDPALNTRIKAAYTSAMSKGMWKGTYSSVDEMEYLAQGAPVWFQVGTAPSGSTNGNKTLRTRAELKAYDQELHDILALIFPAEFIPGIPRVLSAGETGASAQERAVSLDPFLPPQEIRDMVNYH